MPPPDAKRKLVAILSADVVGYSRLMAADEASTVANLEALREAIEGLAPQHGGRVVNFVGDNFLAEFQTATDAMNCAVAIQQQIETRNQDAPRERKMQFRIGIHVGEVRVEGERIFGTGVNIAARLEGLAEPGGVCVSATVREQIGEAHGLACEDLGLQEVKNIPSPVHAFRLSFSPRLHGAVEDSLPAAAPSIAVLPFVNMSADPEQEYFGDGMAEELINALAHVDGLRVIARTSAFSFKGQQADISTIGKKLNVAAVLEGSVRKAGNRLRISAQLIDVAGGHHLWSEIYDRSLEDVFEIQDEIARTIVLKIKPKLLGETAASLVKPLTSNQEAYDLYLRAGDRIWRMSAADNRVALDMLVAATEIDPGFAQAWARLALGYAQMDSMWDEDVRLSEKADAALARALAIDPDDAEVHTVNGRLLWSPRKNFQHREALRAFDRALQRRPGEHQARMWRGIVLFHVGLMDEAIEELHLCLELQPEDARSLQFASQVAWAQQRHDEASGYMARAFTADPANFYNHLFAPAYLIYRDQLDAAADAMETARRVVGEDALLDSSAALLWARRGDQVRAREALARALSDVPSFSHTHHVWHFAAAASAVLGEQEEAVERVRRAAATGFPNYPLFRDDPHLRGLRETAGMKSLLADLEREWDAYRQEFGRT